MPDRRITRVLLLVTMGLPLLLSVVVLGCSAEEPTPTSTPINVLDYGAKGDGTTDDTAAIVAAMSAAVSNTTHSVYVPAGVYEISSITVPRELTVTGSDAGSTWLKGRVLFGSNQRYVDLKIGDYGASAVQNESGATNTTFERCRFRGGGGSDWTYVVRLGMSDPCSHITFSDCEVERNLGTEGPEGDDGFNNVAIISASDSGEVHDITFEGCHIGVSNGQGGRDIGSPRMGLECYTERGVTTGWYNITVRNCVFEAADYHTADFSDNPTARGTGLLIEGCTFKGGGYAQTKWMFTLVLEMPLNPIVRNNTFYRGYGDWGYVFGIGDRDNPDYGPSGALITGNVFDLDTDNGIPPTENGWPFGLGGQGNRFIGNTVHCHYGTRELMLIPDDARDSVVAGNTFNVGSRPLFRIFDGASRNTLSPNTVQ